MSVETNCAAVKDLFALYLYGELSFDEEERVESHLDKCVECSRALERQREVQMALDNIAIEPAPSLLHSCREDLHYRLGEEQVAPVGRRGWWEQLVDVLAGRTNSGWLRPVGALTLVSLGFGVARILPPGTFGSGGNTLMGVGEPAASRVRYVEPASNGRVQLVVDETSQRIISGPVDSPNIRVLLFSAAKDPSDPGLRADTVEILNSNAQFSEVRDALIGALKDSNAGVRLKAMAGLRSFAQQPEVRSALTQVLLADANPEMRTQAIDLLTRSLNQDNPVMGFDRTVIGAMQELLQKESNAYIRQRCKMALESVKASTEAY